MHTTNKNNEEVKKTLFYCLNDQIIKNILDQF